MKKLILGLLLLTGLTTNGFASFGPDQSHHESQFLDIHYGVYNTQGETHADVLFLHGFGDSYQNHPRLFKLLTDNGLRVIGFDYPSHGKTKSFGFKDLDHTTFTQLTEYAETILTKTAEENRPLYLIGWSTGGLLAIRMVQKLMSSEMKSRVRGIVTYAPGVSVKKCVGGNLLCKITNESLTHDVELHERPITPKFPAARIGFASRLLYNAHQSFKSEINVPSLVFIASEKDDHYVKTKKLIKWVKKQRKKHKSKVTAYHCETAKHELDNEPAKYGGKQVRKNTVRFILNDLGVRGYRAFPGPCKAI